MEKLVRRTTIHAPVEEVFHFLEDKTHLPEFWPSMVEVSNISDLPSGGKHFEWIYKMAGMKFNGVTDEVEVVRNRKIVGKNEKGIQSTVIWNFEEHGGDTDVIFEADYRVPVALVGRLAEKVIVKLNENEAEMMLANLKIQIEA